MLYHVFWLGRTGSILQLIGGGISIIVEIMGAEKVQNTIDAMKRNTRMQDTKQDFLNIIRFDPEAYEDSTISQLLFWLIILGVVMIIANREIDSQLEGIF